MTLSLNWRRRRESAAHHTDRHLARSRMPQRGHVYLVSAPSYYEHYLGGNGHRLLQLEEEGGVAVLRRLQDHDVGRLEHEDK